MPQGDREKLHETVLHSLAAIVWAVDRDLRFVRPPPERLGGGDQLVGRPLREYFGAAAAEEEHAAALEGEVVLLDFVRDGRAFQGELSPHLDDAGATVGVVGVALDVTARQAVRAHQWEAEKLELIGRLAGGMAHDFNNVLTIIVSYAQFLLERFEPGSEGYEDAEIIHSAADRAGGLISKLLTFARRQVSHPALRDANELLAELLGTLEQRLGDGVILHRAFAPEALHVHIDPQQLDDAVVELCNNARDAMQGQGELFIETHSVAVDAARERNGVGVEPGQYVVITITDTGCGMGAAERQKAFEPFFSTKSRGKGTGLGLAAVHGIVRQAGGNVWVCSEPGAGTTFKLYLPQVRPGDGRPAPLHTSTPPSARGEGRILLWDTDEGSRRSVVRALRTHGYEVAEADSGEAALRLLRAEPGIELVLTDAPPDWAAQALRAELQAQHPRTPVLFMSGHSQGAMAQRGISTRDSFLPKPFSNGLLLDKVHQALEDPR